MQIRFLIQTAGHWRKYAADIGKTSINWYVKQLRACPSRYDERETACSVPITA